VTRYTSLSFGATASTFATFSDVDGFVDVGERRQQGERVELDGSIASAF
jgi:hypothetical protein